jgi:hypothetical protein
VQHPHAFFHQGGQIHAYLNPPAYLLLIMASCKDMDGTCYCIFEMGPLAVRGLTSVTLGRGKKRATLCVFDTFAGTLHESTYLTLLF